MDKYKNKKHLSGALAKSTQTNTLEEFAETTYLSLDDKKRIVLIAGASSSGKGYTADALARYLEQKGLRPLVLSTDSYYKGVSRSIVENAIKNNNVLYNLKEHIPEFTKIVREVTEFAGYEGKTCEENMEKITYELEKFFLWNKMYPYQNEIAEGIKFEYEHIDYDQPHMVNLRQLAKDIKKILAGEKIVVPDYSFMTGEPTLYESNAKYGKDYDTVIVEGIFALRPELLSHLNKGSYVPCAINCDIKTLLTRKLYRDLKVGRCSHTAEEIVFNFLNQTLPSFYEHIRPSMKNADIVLNSNLSESEIKLKSAQKQFKVRLSDKKYAEILAHLEGENAKNHLFERQIDHYLSPAIQDNNNILIRVREVDGKAVGLTIKIREQGKNSKAINVDEFDLRAIISKQNQEIDTFLSNFKNAGFEEDFVVKKDRKTYSHKGFQIKLDKLDGLGRFAEFDADNLNTAALAFFKQFDLVAISEESYYDLQKSYIFKQQTKSSIEKEYKFKVDKLPQGYDEKLYIKQHYLSNEALPAVLRLLPAETKISGIKELRVRFLKSESGNEKIFLTLKSGESQNRHEIERELTFSEWEKLKKYVSNTICKTRYKKQISGLVFEFDEYDIKDKKLYVCEVETNQKEDYAKITQTLNSLGLHFEDVTNLNQYKNASLARI